MHFAGIKLPDKLVTAHAEGELVFFVGAGASMSPPTNLPNFTSLTRDLVSKASVPVPLEQICREPDVVLGQLEEQHRFPVHDVVATEITKGHARNQLHDALAVIAAAPGTVRLVTTNYDDHLHGALDALGQRPVIFEAPALPAGGDFEGLVHLHGRLGQLPRRLVITDTDFSRAYITEGWATQFLRELFSTFVVCFVGYSHDDRMMEYLAKGLPSNARERYIFTDEDSAARWSRLHLNPILYPAKKYETVLRTLQVWGAWARDTPLGRAERIRSLGGDAPPVEPDDQDFLAVSLRDPVLAPEVCALATTPEWIEWMFQQPVLHALMGRPEALAPADSHAQVGRWIAATAVSADHFEYVYDAVWRTGYKVEPAVVSSLLWHLIREGVDEDCVSTWLRWILAQSRRGSVDERGLELLWGAGNVPLSWTDTMLLLDHLTGGWVLDEPSVFRGRQHASWTLGWSFREGMRRLERTDPQEVAELLRWLTSFFEHTHLRLASRAGGSDRWSSSRSSIAPHEQDEFGLDSAEGALIDRARDTLSAARAAALPAARLTRSTWLTSRAPLLRRLALHDLATDSDVAADELVSVILDQELTFEVDLHHEVYSAFALTAPNLDDTEFERLVAAVSDGPPSSDLDEVLDSDDRQRFRDRMIFDRLHWLLKHRPEAPRPAVLDEIAERHPDWGFDNDHADFTSFMEVHTSSIEDEWPWSPEEFHNKVAESPGDALAALGAVPRPEDFWWGGGDMLRTTVERWPDDGFALWTTAEPRVRRCVIAGWAMAPLGEDQMDEIMRLLKGADLTDLGREIAKLLHPWSNDSEVRTRWIGRNDARALARATFTAFSTSSEPDVSGDLYTRAINSTLGVLSEFWIAAAGHDIRNGAGLDGRLGPDVTEALGELLRPHAHRAVAMAPLVAQLDFLVRADPEWAGAHLLPALDPRDHPWEEIAPLWEIVVRGRISEQLLQVCLLDWLPLALDAASKDAASKVASDANAAVGDDKVTNDIARMAALIAVRSTIDDQERVEWVRTLYARSDARTGVHWVENVRHLVRDLDPEARSSLWRRWVGLVLHERAAGVPRKLTPQEITAFVGWVGLVDEPDAVGAAVSRILSTGAGFSSFTGMWGGLQVPNEALTANPTTWARLIVGMLRHTSTVPDGLGNWLHEAESTVAQAGADEATLAALRAALFVVPR